MQLEKRKVKIAYMSPDMMIRPFCEPKEILDVKHKEDVFVPIVKLGGVPEDARVLKAWYDPARAAFAVLIYHDSFEEVPEFEIPPTIKIVSKIVRVNFKGDVLTESKVSFREFF